MKKIWSIRKDDEAVSPVIATILMVAITVVLAAVLYVMVLGIGGDTTGNINVSVNKESTGTNNWTVSITAISGTSQLATSDVYVIAKDETGAVVLTSTKLSDMTTAVYDSGVQWNEAHQTGYLNAGDYFILNKTDFPAGSTIELIDPTGAQKYLSYTL